MIDIGPGQAPLTPDGYMSLAQVVGALPAQLVDAAGDGDVRAAGAMGGGRGARLGREDRPW